MSKAVIVCNIYIPPSVYISLSDLEQLFQQLPAPFVLVGDFNAHSPLWGDVRQDSRGQMEETLLDDYNLCLLKTDKPTYRHHSHQSFFVPGLSICGPSLVLKFDWLTHSDLCGSDHFPIILKTSPNEDEPAAEHWRFGRADWMSFRTLCASRLSGELALSEDPVAQFTDTWLRLQTKLFQNHTFLKTHSRKYRGLTMLVKIQPDSTFWPPNSTTVDSKIDMDVVDDTTVTDTPPWSQSEHQICLSLTKFKKRFYKP